MKSQFYGRKLSTNRQVLQVFFHHHRKKKLTIRKSSSEITELMIHWNRTGIPVNQIQQSTLKLEKLHLTWKNLQRSKGRKKSPTLQKKEKDFDNKLNQLFNIAPQNVISQLTEDQRLFLSSQQDSSRFIPTRLSQSFSGLSAASDDTDESGCTGTAELYDHTSIQREISDYEDELNNPPRKKRKIINQEVAAACDRIKVTDTDAIYLIGTVIRSAKIDVNECTFSVSTLRRKRIDFRGKNCADAILDHLRLWNIENKIKAFCFDTTSSNTGCHKGIMQPRNDYREFLELSCIFLGGVPPRGITFKKPGANQHARWMAKAIYCLKLFIFKDELFKNARKSREVTELRQICIFIVLFYVKIWFTAFNAFQAPLNDLTLIQDLIRFKCINSQVANAALTKLRNHIWYFNETLAALAFFDSRISVECKRLMVDAIKHREGTLKNLSRLILSDSECQSLPDVDISHFITKSSLHLFQICGLPYDFLDADPTEWENEESFIRCRVVFENMKVVNDVAERGVALVEEYTGLITRDERQYQALLQVVKDHRKKYPNPSKKNFFDTDADDE
ncbi:hypothetical protein ALC62_14760 [Cyphomyrmex costatus]|uniref:Uncharacterized protein n=1 Tax=Cyphomyrmex costatus TaxID=456900 RepID=A0A151I8G0_9HYME|nr:hypothetical protein ALC62_14760 [Cyphomyrmex costatus]